MKKNKDSHLNGRNIKSNGAYYTPENLANFLAEVTLRQVKFLNKKVITILDPACGDGSLLKAIACATNVKTRQRIKLVGYEVDTVAINNAKRNLRNLKVAGIEIRNGDFLDLVTCHTDNETANLFASNKLDNEKYDIVISNPPYVRTQTLGAERSQQLAAKFGLNGRVDLYHAFIKAISFVLRQGGVLGLLTSNRFIVTKSGESIRDLLRSNFNMYDLYDLGDTKLFEAAVLPATLVAKRTPTPQNTNCKFTRIYEHRNENSDNTPNKVWSTVLEAIKKSAHGIVKTNERCFKIERGDLAYSNDRKAPWVLSSLDTKNLMISVAAHRAFCFGDIAQVRVGIKTTADDVFIRDDWNTLPKNIRPETALLKPLITHHIAKRWALPENTKKTVLYPHGEETHGARIVVNINDYPQAHAYLKQHQLRLKARKYVIDAGRQWYEIWVPQQPSSWLLPKVVYPDISEEPKFFLDLSGAVVNGDCYWITLNEGVEPDYLYLLLAVANSTFATMFYDTAFHNKLYAGRRRFMTQYVRQFPIPSIEKNESQKIIKLTKTTMLKNNGTNTDQRIAGELDTLVWTSFGLSPKVVR